MGAIGRAEGEGGAHMSLTNFGSRYRRANPAPAGLLEHEPPRQGDKGIPNSPGVAFSAT